MFEGWDPVRDIEKGTSDIQENAKHAFDDASKGFVEAQNEAAHGAQNAQEQVQQGASEFCQNVQKGANDIRENTEKGVAEACGNAELGFEIFRERAVEEPLRQFAEAINDFVNSALPGAAQKAQSPYEHIPGNTPHESILLSATLLELRDGSVLRGLCQQTDGTWSFSELDLNNHYSAHGGKFSVDTGGFKDVARNLWLEPGDSSVVLHGELNESDSWATAQIDLSIRVVVKEGRFVFEKHDGPWDRDGFFARKTQGIPLFGYITAVVQSSNDNQDHAQRALALCTSSTIVTVASIAGFFMKGPFGAGIAAGLSTPLAKLAESHIAGNIQDPRLRDEFEQATIGRAIVESLTNAIGGEASGYAMQYAGDWLSSSGTELVSKAIEAIKGALSGASLGLAQDVVNTRAGASEALAIALIGKIVQAMKGDGASVKEWDSIDH
ncbi:hypothetical protein BKA70DRAFT_1554159 [Coprinopsis sp. MPI-PUGE-AT-0042]|nr:hypothetical protein BKA70DRAFT_1554159 [Coprinopsis sp. MPI-PUGE-AT-0042]